MTRDELITRLWECAFVFISRDEFAAGLEGAEIEPMLHEGRVIGAYVMRGPEFHFAKFDATPITRTHVDRVREVIAQYGYACTKTPKTDMRQCRFNERCGFERVAEDDHHITYRITRLRERKQPCPQSHSSPV